MQQRQGVLLHSPKRFLGTHLCCVMQQFPQLPIAREVRCCSTVLVQQPDCNLPLGKQQPDAVFAEIVHLPEERTGNINPWTRNCTGWTWPAAKPPG